MQTRRRVFLPALTGAKTMATVAARSVSAATRVFRSTALSSSLLREHRELPRNDKGKKNMNTQFDELTKSLAQSVTRRTALKKFSIGLAGMALACFGLAGKAEAGPKSCSAHVNCPPS